MKKLLSALLIVSCAALADTKAISPKQVLDTVVLQTARIDWDGDGTLDEISLNKTTTNEKDTVTLVIAYYDKKQKVINSEESQNIGTGEMGCCPTSFKISNQIISVKTSEMRNEVAFKLRFDKENKRTQLIEKNIEYYTSGGNGPRNIHVNLLTGIKTIKTSRYNTKTSQFVNDKKQITSKIKIYYIPLAAVNIEQLYEQ